MVLYELRDFRRGCDEVLCELRKRCLPDYDQQPDAVPYHGGEFVPLVADARVVAAVSSVDCIPAFKGCFYPIDLYILIILRTMSQLRAWFDVHIVRVNRSSQ